MNHRKGLTRIAIVWIGFWGLWFWNGYEMSVDGERGYMEASARDDDLMMRYYDRKMTRGADQLEQAMEYGLVMPIVFILVAGSVFWVWRGFKRKPAVNID